MLGYQEHGPQCRVIADGELFTTASKLASTVRCSGIVGVGVERCRWRPYSPPRCCRGASVDLEPLSMVSVLASTPPNPTTLSVQRQRAEAVLDGCPFIHTLTQSIISDWLCSNSTPWHQSALGQPNSGNHLPRSEAPIPTCVSPPPSLVPVVQPNLPKAVSETRLARKRRSGQVASPFCPVVDVDWSRCARCPSRSLRPL